MEKLKAGTEKLGLHLTPEQLEKFEIYYRELVAWNKKINLTSITGYEEVQVKHFLDSLTVTLAASAPDKDRALNVIDIGTGAGMPGIPLKIVFPDIHLTLLEATVKKTKFLQYIVKRLETVVIEIVAGRAEEAAHNNQYREKFDLALSRAVAPLPALVELTLPFITVGGRLISQKKGEIRREIEQSKRSIEVMGGVLREIKPVGLEELDNERCLVVIDKVKPTPPEYPRRPGLPVKRPLNA
jgi:16S rRNA (guanine527-N7)-methyltransferase